MPNSKFAPTGLPMTKEQMVMDEKMNPETGINYVRKPPKTLGEYVKQIDERVKRLEDSKPFVYRR